MIVQHLPQQITIECATSLHSVLTFLIHFERQHERTLINPHQRCGYRDSPFARIYFFLYCRVWNELEDVVALCDTELILKHCFVIETYVEDVKQDEKHVPDLLESIMRPTCLVKEELRTNSCKSNGLQTRLKKTHFPSFFAGPGPGPGPCEAGWKI